MLNEITFKSVDGRLDRLNNYAGRVVIVVNVASKCGLTPQYEGLQKLHEEYAHQGLAIIAFPANDFRGQEPGTDSEILEFCSVSYGVTFPIMSKISVIGKDKHPLYSELSRRVPTAPGKEDFRNVLRDKGITPTCDPDVLWNFEKFLLSRAGEVVGRFAPNVTVDDQALREAILSELARSYEPNTAAKS
ncbi:glutathione peroxidase [Rhodococcus erythropolis]|uniref:glutathione peroxidase n=1 Tax=Rhodococcus erythropolis TaxID=1833 RepID=UPI000877EB27|nr:glutathione peroxidase [Rhodococcus erythropolis]OFV78039.1 hydroperoxy fatty acid reductase gpx1 [Rhodococcus erythropolis]